MFVRYRALKSCRPGWNGWASIQLLRRRSGLQLAPKAEQGREAVSRQVRRCDVAVGVANWGTDWGTCPPSTSSYLIYSVHLRAAQSLTATLCVRCVSKHTRALQPVATSRQSPYLRPVPSATKPAIIIVTPAILVMTSFLCRHSLLSWPRPALRT